MKNNITALLILLYSLNSAAQTICDQFEKSIVDSLKSMSLARTDGAGDNSAPRDTNRKLDVMINASIINSNLILMKENKCQLPKTPITADAYRENASACSIAIFKGSGNTPPVECNKETWTRAR